MPLTVGVLKETMQGETRGALTPEITSKLQKLGVSIVMSVPGGYPLKTVHYPVRILPV